MSSIYVISLNNRVHNYFRICTFTGTEEELVESYKPDNIEVHHFIPCVNEERDNEFLRLNLGHYLFYVWEPIPFLHCSLKEIEHVLDQISLLGSPNMIGYHNFKELEITDRRLIGTVKITEYIFIVSPEHNPRDEHIVSIARKGVIKDDYVVNLRVPIHTNRVRIESYLTTILRNYCRSRKSPFKCMGCDLEYIKTAINLINPADGSIETGHNNFEKYWD